MRAMSGERVEAFLESLKRCQATPVFLTAFYERFMDSSDEVRQKFAHTDFERQTRMLADSLLVLAVAAQGRQDSPAWESLPTLAARHSKRQLDVPPHLYDLWLECLIQSARQCDPEFSPSVERAWRETLAVGIAYMKGNYA
jgi:hemoglobin-like flavoprotein